MNDELQGSDIYETAHLAAELVPSNSDPLWVASVAQAYATLALAREQRATTLAILVSADDVDRTVAARGMAELTELLGWDRDA